MFCSKFAAARRLRLFCKNSKTNGGFIFEKNQSSGTLPGLLPNRHIHRHPRRHTCCHCRRNSRRGSCETAKYRYRAQYSLDVGDGIEDATLRQLPNPETILENYQQREELYAAIMSLPKKQAKRIYARLFLGLTINEIAQIEGVSKSRVSESIC